MKKYYLQINLAKIIKNANIYCFNVNNFGKNAIFKSSFPNKDCILIFFRIDMPRLFLGIPISASVKEELAHFQAAQHAYKGVRWTKKEKLHITAYFFAEVAEEMMDNLKALLYIALKKQASFELEFEQFILAPPKQSPRMIWARFKKSETFISLHEEVHSLYSQIEKPIQRRKKPIPHITLARLKEEAPKEEKDYRLNDRCGNIEVEKLILWKSSFTSDGTVYEALEEYPLQ